jgi:hypothetical protein
MVTHTDTFKKKKRVSVRVVSDGNNNRLLSNWREEEEKKRDLKDRPQRLIST